MSIKALKKQEEINVDLLNEAERPKSKDGLKEVEKIILDRLVEKGYVVGNDDWGFKVEINTTWKQKSLNVLLRNQDGIKPIFTTTKEDVEQMYDEAIMFFQNEF